MTGAQAIQKTIPLRWEQAQAEDTKFKLKIIYAKRANSRLTKVLGQIFPVPLAKIIDAYAKPLPPKNFSDAKCEIRDEAIQAFYISPEKTLLAVRKLGKAHDFFQIYDIRFGKFHHRVTLKPHNDSAQFSFVDETHFAFTSEGCIKESPLLLYEMHPTRKKFKVTRMRGETPFSKLCHFSWHRKNMASAQDIIGWFDNTSRKLLLLKNYTGFLDPKDGFMLFSREGWHRASFENSLQTASPFDFKATRLIMPRSSETSLLTRKASKASELFQGIDCDTFIETPYTVFASRSIGTEPYETHPLYYLKTPKDL